MQPTESGHQGSLCQRSSPSQSSVLVGFAALCLVWGSTYLGIRVAIETLPPFVMAGVRWLLAGVPLALAIAHDEDVVGPQTRVTLTGSPKTPYTIAQDAGHVLVRFDAAIVNG